MNYGHVISFRVLTQIRWVMIAVFQSHRARLTCLSSSTLVCQVGCLVRPRPAQAAEVRRFGGQLREGSGGLLLGFRALKRADLRSAHPRITHRSFASTNRLPALKLGQPLEAPFDDCRNWTLGRRRH